MCSSFLLILLACQSSRSHPVAASGGPPQRGLIPSEGCDGRAPLDEAIEGVQGARASWFNDPSGHERLYVLEAGPTSRRTGEPTLVLIHGVGSIGIRDYYPALAQLSRTRRILAIDLPGFGRSNPQDKDFGPERLARSVDTVVRTCAAGRIDVVGHSSGGSLAVLFAAKRADVVRRLVLADVAGILRPEVLLHGQLHQTLSGMREHVPRLTKAVESTGGVMIDAVQALVPTAKQLTDTGLLGQSPGVLAASALLDFNFGPALAEIRAPTLILWGEEDHVVPPRIARLLADRIAHTDLAFIADSGHVPMKDQPEKMAALVNAYLDGPLPAHAPSPAPAPVSERRDGVCNEQDDVTLSGDYDSVVITRCKNVRLDKVRARRVTIRKSDGHLDGCILDEGLVVDDVDLSLTGGELHGEVALETSDSTLDIAGVTISGTRAAIHADKKSHFVISVSKLKSPHTDAFMHKDLDLDDGAEL
ncbi:MAG: alpha/beta hydrolase fold protein [Myxococcaceae bacterium]|nr:alpha/beta hydrolase fold protein [Myxococcaceae bacterium]